jgi:hypothetical protein
LFGLPENTKGKRQVVSDDIQAKVPKISIRWKAPWCPIENDKEQQSIQVELLKELSPEHPLWGTNPVAFGRHQGCDDVLVALTENRFAIVHLVWHGKVDQYPDKFPSTTIFTSLPELQKELDSEAEYW